MQTAGAEVLGLPAVAEREDKAGCSKMPGL